MLQIELCPLTTPEFICWSPNLQCDLIGNRAFREIIKVKCNHKGVAFIQGLVSLEEYEETPEVARSLYAERKGHVRTQGEGSCLQASKRTLAGNEPRQYPDLGLLASRTVENYTSVV